MAGKIVSYDQALLQIGIQSADDAAATLTASSVLLVEALEVQIKDQDEEAMNIISDDPFYKPTSRSNQKNIFKFDVPWMFSGTAGTPSALEPLFRACGFNSVSAASTVTYERATQQTFDRATLNMIADIDGEDTHEYRSINASGQIGFTFEAGKRPRLNVSNMIGSYILPAEGTMIEPDWGDQKDNLADEWEGAVAYVGKFTIGGVDKTLCLESVSCDNLGGFAMQRKPTAGCTTKTTATDVQPKLTVVYRIPDLTTEFNPWALDRLACTFGTGAAAGERLKFTFPSVEVVGETKRTKGADGNTYITQTLQALTAPIPVEE